MRISEFSSLFLNDSSVVVPSNKCAENIAIAGKLRKTQKSSLISKEKVDRKDHISDQHSSPQKLLHIKIAPELPFNLF